MLDEKGFKRMRFADYLSVLEEKAKAAFGEKVNLSDKTPLGVILRLFAWGLSLLAQLAESVYNSNYVDTATGVSLDRVAKRIGIRRHQKDFSKGEVILKGDAGKTRPRGFQVGTKSGIAFETIQDVTMDASGSATVPIRAVNAGPSGNVPPDSITVILKPEAGISSVTNPKKTEGGRNRETDIEFRDRYDRSISKGGGSSIESIEATILQLPGVRDCIVEDNDTRVEKNGIPPKAIAPIVFGGDAQAIAKAIFKTKSGGIQSWGTEQVVVLDSKNREQIIGLSRPENVTIYVQATLTTNSQFNSDDYKRVRTAIIKTIGGEDEDEQLYEGLGMEESVVHAMIISAIFHVGGITDVDLKIGTNPEQLGNSNITINKRQVAETDWQKVAVS
ncbi:baseplate J/gp47 family protein [Brevibacillus reuszeri]|uniref:baseplate J/gp47 family protein n=1 Tax=Brevibacillus reuszeri TaxID=54915 RepID=UPI00289F756D|nr:baseplate J/gp47 family protein [Brevibacillus reuszeri]